MQNNTSYTLVPTLPFVPAEDVEIAFNEIALSKFYLEPEDSEYGVAIHTFLAFGNPHILAGLIAQVDEGEGSFVSCGIMECLWPNIGR